MRCVGVAEIRFIKYFRDEGMGKSVENMVVEESRGGGGAARMPARMPRRRSGGGGVTCNLHVAAHAACQASQSDSRSLPLPCHHALWQRCSLRRPAKPRPRQTCKRRRRAHYLSRGGWRCRGKRSQLDNTTICLVRRVALSCELQSYDSWRSAWHASSPSAPLQHVNSHDCPGRPPGQPPVPAAS